MSEYVGVTNERTGRYQVVDLSSRDAYHMIRSEIGEMVMFLGKPYTVTDSYDAIVEFGDNRNSFTMNFAIDQSEAHNHIERHHRLVA